MPLNTILLLSFLSIAVQLTSFLSHVLMGSPVRAPFRPMLLGDVTEGVCVEFVQVKVES